MDRHPEMLPKRVIWMQDEETLKWVLVALSNDGEEIQDPSQYEDVGLPPEGMPSGKVWMRDEDTGKWVNRAVAASEEELAQADAALRRASTAEGEGHAHGDQYDDVGPPPGPTRDGGDDDGDSRNTGFVPPRFRNTQRRRGGGGGETSIHQKYAMRLSQGGTMQQQKRTNGIIVANGGTSPTICEEEDARDLSDDMGGVYHAVRPGDTFQFICLKYKVSADALRGANNFTGSTLKNAPKNLKIPPSAPKKKPVTKGGDEKDDDKKDNRRDNTRASARPKKEDKKEPPNHPNSTSPQDQDPQESGHSPVSVASSGSSAATHGHSNSASLRKQPPLATNHKQPAETARSYVRRNSDVDVSRRDDGGQRGDDAVERSPDVHTNGSRRRSCNDGQDDVTDLFASYRNRIRHRDGDRAGDSTSRRNPSPRNRKNGEQEERKTPPRINYKPAGSRGHLSRRNAKEKDDDVVKRSPGSSNGDSSGCNRHNDAQDDVPGLFTSYGNRINGDGGHRTGNSASRKNPPQSNGAPAPVRSHLTKASINNNSNISNSSSNSNSNNSRARSNNTDSEQEKEIVQYHWVQPDDSFRWICLKYKVNANDLRKANNFTGSNLKLAPKKLIIPKASLSSSIKRPSQRLRRPKSKDGGGDDFSHSMPELMESTCDYLPPAASPVPRTVREDDSLASSLFSVNSLVAGDDFDRDSMNNIFSSDMNNVSAGSSEFVVSDRFDPYSQLVGQEELDMMSTQGCDSDSSDASSDYSRECPIGEISTVRYHDVRPSDTIERLCMKYRISAPELRRANIGLTGRNLQTGPKRLIVPPGGSTRGGSGSADAAGGGHGAYTNTSYAKKDTGDTWDTETLTTTHDDETNTLALSDGQSTLADQMAALDILNEGEDEQLHHDVQPSDTLQGVCLLYGISAHELRRANNFRGLNLSSAPERLVIPKNERNQSKGFRTLTQDEKVQSLMAHVPISRQTKKPLLSQQEARAYLEFNDWNFDQALRNVKVDVEWSSQKSRIPTKSSYCSLNSR